ncbi:helix-turn-helix transcriptional regulator [Tsukamurella soli]|uniref:Helix-turn-helix domain-containing protein n=1 Tax=Tsukamurella soli TaxID=644556 RepID=A0ABP8J6J2_9ACTN
MTSTWAVTTTYDVDPDMETMDRWETALAGADGSVGRRPRVLYADDRIVTDVTVYVDAPDDVAALQSARDLVGPVIGEHPVIASEVEDEQVHYDRADAPTLPHLVSAPEVGEILEVSRQRVHQLRSTSTFPQPLFELRSGAIWDRAAIEAFAQRWDRRPGPRRSAAAVVMEVRPPPGARPRGVVASKRVSAMKTVPSKKSPTAPSKRDGSHGSVPAAARRRARG